MIYDGEAFSEGLGCSLISPKIMLYDMRTLEGIYEIGRVNLFGSMFYKSL